jgi:hypothetical protein
MQKCMGFAYGATMLGQSSSMTTKSLKINIYLSLLHCIAYRSNLTTLEVAKSIECKFLSIEIDALVNFLATHFLNSIKNLSS